jgi:predicted DCC family thiol-disulfide oxidoreductase YuxK
VLSRFGVGVEDVRRRLHAVDAEGRLHVGADCAIAIWLRTPGDAWLTASRAISMPATSAGSFASRARSKRTVRSQFEIGPLSANN